MQTYQVRFTIKASSQPQYENVQAVSKDDAQVQIMHKYGFLNTTIMSVVESKV